jgi:adenylate kinase
MGFQAPSKMRNNVTVKTLGRFLLYLFALSSQALAIDKLIVLIGAPGAGKNTQSEILKRDLGCAIVSTDAIIANNQMAFERFSNPGIQGVEPRLDPALNNLVEGQLMGFGTSKCVVLDGYPASKTQGDYLGALITRMNLPKPVVIHLDVPDDVIRKRLKTNKASVVDQNLKDYHRELDFASLYFPNADIHKVDGTKKPEDVAKEIRKYL